MAGPVLLLMVDKTPTTIFTGTGTTSQELTTMRNVVSLASISFRERIKVGLMKN